MKDYVSVAVPAPIRWAPCYRVPSELAARVQPGVRVRVPLGSREVTGLVLGQGEPPPEDSAVREVIEVLGTEDGDTALPEDLIDTALWTIDYYLAAPGDVARALLPAATQVETKSYYRLTDRGRQSATMPGAPSALTWLARRARGTARASTLERQFGARAAIKDWIDAGLLETVSERAARGASAREAVVEVSGSARESPEAVRADLQRAAAQRRAFDVALDAREPMPPAELARRAETSTAVVSGLVRRGALIRSERSRAVAAAGEFRFPVEPPPKLSQAQATALESTKRAIDVAAYRAMLLFGVTGSGKTEVYLRAAEHALSQRRSVLFLVPEIGLTPRLAHALAQRFGDRVVVQHSGLTDAQRYDGWRRALNGSAQIVVGARSALFAPLARPGLIVVDEEHDSGYKQEESPRYHARDLALVRGRAAGAVVMLGSATPSIEAWAMAHDERAELLELPERVSGGTIPRIELIDMREEFRHLGHDAPLSRELVSALEKTVAAGQQAMILLNRRGFTRTLLCRKCGEAVSCDHCSVALTWHKFDARMRCHYCDASKLRPARCPSCESEHLADVGHGTQRLEIDLAEALPGARIERLDRDVVRSSRKLSHVLSDFGAGEIDVLVGTQMIAKGHHFPNVTLVGVVNADAALRIPDFRAGERTYQLLTQVAGRAGRGADDGRVLVQVFRPEHDVLRAAVEGDFRGFADREMRARQLLHYPPSSALANLIVRHRDREQAHRRAVALATRIRETGESLVAVVGPSPAPIERLRDQWRIQLIVRARRRRRLIDTLRRALSEVLDDGKKTADWLTIDIDPYQLM